MPLLDMMLPMPKPGDIVTLKDGRRVMSRPKLRSHGRLERMVLPAAGQGGYATELWGEADIKNGPGKCLVPKCGCDQAHILARNKIVGQGLRHIINALAVTQAGTAAVFSPFALITEAGTALTIAYMYVGTNTGATTETQSGLGSPNTTKPNTTGRVLSNPSSGVYRLAYTATWNTGTLPAITVGEIAIYGYLVTTLGSAYSSANQAAQSAAGSMFARLSSGDSEFTAFLINVAAPLVIEYRLSAVFT